MSFIVSSRLSVSVFGFLSVSSLCCEETAQQKFSIWTKQINTWIYGIFDECMKLSSAVWVWRMKSSWVWQRAAGQNESCCSGTAHRVKRLWAAHLLRPTLWWILSLFSLSFCSLFSLIQDIFPPIRFLFLTFVSLCGSPHLFNISTFGRCTRRSLNLYRTDDPTFTAAPHSDWSAVLRCVYTCINMHLEWSDHKCTALSVSLHTWHYNVSPR